MHQEEFDRHITMRKKHWASLGHEISTDNLALKFLQHYHYYPLYRIRIRDRFGEEHSGYVCISTGWKPAFILLYNKRCCSSSIVLHDDDEIIRIYN